MFSTGITMIVCGSFLDIWENAVLAQPVYKPSTVSNKITCRRLKHLRSDFLRSKKTLVTVFGREFTTCSFGAPDLPVSAAISGVFDQGEIETVSRCDSNNDRQPEMATEKLIPLKL